MPELMTLGGQEKLLGNTTEYQAPKGWTNLLGPEPFLPLPSNHIITEMRTSLFKQHLTAYKRETISDKGRTLLLQLLMKNRYKSPRQPQAASR